MLTGTIARTLEEGLTGSPRVSSQARRAPATTARTTSLTVIAASGAWALRIRL